MSYCNIQNNKVFEFEALVVEGQAIVVDVQGMKFENEQRIYLGQSMAYVEDSFYIAATKLNVIAGKVRSLKT